MRHLRIGQKVELEVDMYGSKQTLAGRISGFTMGTGSTLALLPAQNATGNFVKVANNCFFRFADGKLVEQKGVWDTLSLMRQINADLS